MTRRRALLLASSVLAALLALAGALEGLGRSIEPRPNWQEELHPLLGAAPEESFAFTLEKESFLDFRGKRFPRRRTGERVLLVGGGRALTSLALIERKLPGAEVVLAARRGYTTVQETVLVGRFLPSLDASHVIAVDGCELLSPGGPPGWTEEWDWSYASIRSPLGEVAARHSGVARLIFVPRPRPLSSEERLRRYLEGTRSVARLAALVRGAKLRWAFEAPGLEGARSVYERARGERREGVEAFFGVEAMVGGL